MSTLANLLAQLDPDSKIKGTQFEHLCKWFLENDKRFRHLTQVWLWDDWPGRWGIDAGIDLIAEDNKGRLWAIQSKAYKATYSIKKRDVDTFLSESNRAVISHRLLIATTDRVGETGERAINNQEKPVTFFGLTKLEKAQVNWPESLSDLYPPVLAPKEPRDYQIEAINAVVDGFSKSDRGQMIMACGTGKTLTALFIKEKLSADRTLVLAPSLSLLDQTMTEWTANATTAFEYLPVCSDESVGDSIVTSASELGDVTTNPAVIAKFLRGKGPKVVFSTYQSSPEIAKAFALGRVRPFDLIVADEAHRTTGRTTARSTDRTTAFAIILDNKKIPAKRRLFMTATPRYFTGRVIGEAAALDHDVASMNNEIKYGPVFHRLRFSEAIERGLLTDYQVVVIGVDEAECRELADKARFVEGDGIRDTDGRTLAAQIGLAKAMNNYDLRRAISFHSRVDSARRFSHSLPRVISWMPDDQRPTGQVWANYVSGEMTTKHRNVRLRDLGNIDQDHRGLLANARCLTEGVDVPTLDGVVFIDPKHSEVDIVQAVGRAIRLAPNKHVGTIVIPVFMSSDEDHEVVLDDSSFKTVWWVVKALRLHDEELAEHLDSLRLGLGLRRVGQGRPEKIVLDLPAYVGADFVRAFNTRLVSSVTAPWLQWFGMLQQHYEDTGTANVAQTHKTPDGYFLGIWANGQRTLHRTGKLSPDRARLLENLGDWSWEPDADQWQKFIEELRKYYEATGTTRVPMGYKTPDGYPLGARVKKRRTLYKTGKPGELSPERIKVLESIGDWSWNIDDAEFQKLIDELKKYYESTGTTNVPKDYKTTDGYSLGNRISKRRVSYNRGTLPPEYIKLLESVGDDWTWKPMDDQWEEFIEELKKYHKATGTTNVPLNYKTPEGYPLGRRTKKRRGLYKAGGTSELSSKRIRILESIGDWSWDLTDDWWTKFIEELRKHYETTGTARVVGRGDDKYAPLAHQVKAQRRLYKAGELSPERIKVLESIGDWSWEVHSDQWKEFIEELKKYFDATGTANVPADYKTKDGYPLGVRATTKRTTYKRGELSSERIKILESFNGWTWGQWNDAWQKLIEELKKYHKVTGTTRGISQSYKTPDGYPLGKRIAMQHFNYRHDKLSADRIKTLESIGDWTWDARS